jgi:tRNA A37 threonylcarbamoyladenosine dehydratase
LRAELILEQLARNRVFLTDAGLSKLRNSFVIIVGCGGVGSHATSALARSGVSMIRLIDFDQVTLSSLNRHSVATLADVGTPKVTTLRRRLEQVTPWVRFDCANELFRPEAAARLLGPLDGKKPDYVIDAIDNIDSKVALLAYCHEHSIPVISSMGAGTKSDPTCVFVGDISASTDDPLSRSTRRRLRAMGVKDGIPVVFSTEKPGPGKAQLLPLPDEEYEKGSVGDLGVLPDFRVRILPVLGTMPAVFGYAAANHVILEITGYPHEYLPAKGREKMYDGMLGQLQSSEEKLAGDLAGKKLVGLKVPVTKDDVGYLVEEVYKGRSVVSGIPTRLCLVRWKKPEREDAVVERNWTGQVNSKVRLDDLVVMTKEEAAVQEQDVLRGERTVEEQWGAEVVRRVEGRMKEERMYERYR